LLRRKQQLAGLLRVLKIPCGRACQAYEEFLEMHLENDCSAGSNLVSSHAVDGGWKPRTVRKRISRSDKNVRDLEYFSAISSLTGKIFATYCSSKEFS